MTVLIVEDEYLAVKKLKKTLLSVDDSVEVVGETDSIKNTVSWLKENPSPDLILMDIELADGQSFDIYNHVQVKSPVIFTTSYDEHALKAFKVNSIDYLLKPVQKEDLQAALDKLKELKKIYSSKPTNELNIETLAKQLQEKMQAKEYRKRFLVKQGQKLVSIEIDEIAYFFSEGRLNFFKTNDGKKFIVDYTMDELNEMLDPKLFFRISRSFYISIDSVKQIEDYFGNRLVLTLKPESEKEVIVSREKVTDFKNWLGK